MGIALTEEYRRLIVNGDGKVEVYGTDPYGFHIAFGSEENGDYRIGPESRQDFKSDSEALQRGMDFIMEIRNGPEPFHGLAETVLSEETEIYY